MKILFVLIVVFLIGCSSAKQQPAPVQQPVVEQIPKEEVEQTNAAPEKIVKFDADVKDLIEKSKARVKSLSYNYRGPENSNELFVFYVKGSRIKYLPPRALRSLDNEESYDSVFIDMELGTAEQHCDVAECAYRGKKQDLMYGSSYILTPFDWIDSLVSAEKIAEEVIESRNTWVIVTDKGTIWMDTFYGVPLKAESNGNSYKYMQMAFNGVQDSQVVPSVQ